MKKHVPLLLLLAMLCPMLLTACAGVDTANQLIADSNSQRLSAYADGMAGCGDNAACQVGLTAAFAGGLGQQQFFRPDTAVDYLRAGLPYAEIGLRAYSIWGAAGGTSGDRAATIVRGDGNTLLVGNRVSAADQSTASIPVDVAYSRLYDGGYNRLFTGGGAVSDDGVE